MCSSQVKNPKWHPECPPRKASLASSAERSRGLPQIRFLGEGPPLSLSGGRVYQKWGKAGSGCIPPCVAGRLRTRGWVGHATPCGQSPSHPHRWAAQRPGCLCCFHSRSQAASPPTVSAAPCAPRAQGSDPSLSCSFALFLNSSSTAAWEPFSHYLDLSPHQGWRLPLAGGLFLSL